MSEISNMDDVIDSRDVIKRIEELREERQGLVDIIADLEAEDEPDADAIRLARQDVEEFDQDIDRGHELKALLNLQDEGEGSPDWHHGETLIRDGYFKDYAQQLAEDIGAIRDDASWPYNCIDWDQAADLLKQDYFTVDYDGETYWIRA